MNEPLREIESLMWECREKTENLANRLGVREAYRYVASRLGPLLARAEEPAKLSVGAAVAFSADRILTGRVEEFRETEIVVRGASGEEWRVEPASFRNGTALVLGACAEDPEQAARERKPCSAIGSFSGCWRDCRECGGKGYVLDLAE